MTDAETTTAGPSIAETITARLDDAMGEIMAVYADPSGVQDHNFAKKNGLAYGLAFALGVMREPYQDREAATRRQWAEAVARVTYTVNGATT
jgi:hypothetical protein